MNKSLSNIKHVALDMDGTIYLSNTLFPFTLDFLNSLTEMGITYSFLTNNPSKSLADYMAKLAKMGIPATEEQMYTTTIATIDYIRANYPSARKLFLLGTPSMISQFEQAGFISCEDSAGRAGHHRGFVRYDPSLRKALSRRVVDFPESDLSGY